MGHQLVRALRRRVEADGRIDALALGEGLLLVAAVDAGTARVDEARDFGVAAKLQDVERRLEIALLVGERMRQRVAHTRLGGEVADEVGPRLLKGAFGRGVVAQVDLVRGEPLLLREKVVPGALEFHGVVVVQAIDADDRVSLLQEPA